MRAATASTGARRSSTCVAPDGRIFDVAAAPRAAAQPPRPASTPSKPREEVAQKRETQKFEALELEALEAYYWGDWARAEALYGEILAQQPNRPGAAAKLAAATRNQALEENYAVARQAGDANDWPAAIEKLEAVVQMDAGYRDAAALLAEAKRRAALSELYAEARLLAGASSWEAVSKAFERMATLDPAPPDPDGLLPLARERLAAAEQERKLAGFYAEGLRLLDAGQPAEAIRRFEAIQALSPSYRQTKGLLVRARQELDSAPGGRGARGAAGRPVRPGDACTRRGSMGNGAGIPGTDRAARAGLPGRPDTG